MALVDVVRSHVRILDAGAMGEDPPSYVKVQSIGFQLKHIIVTVFASLFCLFMTGIIRYLPHHISVMHSRAVYYLWGQEDQASSLWQWIGKGAAPTASYQEL